MQKKVSLGEALKELQEVVSAIEDLDGEVPDQLLPLWDEKVADVEAAVDRRMLFISTCESLSEGLQKEISLLSIKRQKIINSGDRVYNSIKAHMNEYNITELRGTFKKVSLTKNGGSKPLLWKITEPTEVRMRIIDPENVGRFPDGYLIKKEFYALPETFKEDLKVGRLPDDLVVYGESGTHLRIK